MDRCHRHLVDAITTHPNLWKLNNYIKQEQTSTEIEHGNLLQGLRVKRDQILKEKRLVIMKKLYFGEVHPGGAVEYITNLRTVMGMGF